MTHDAGTKHAAGEVRIRIFPLPNVVLFPGVRLPLHIFEPRYRAMTRDALTGDRTLGMILLYPEAPPDSMGRPAVARVGCVGTILEHRLLEDGRFQLLLQGRSRFEVVREVELGDPFRSVDAELRPDRALADLSEPERCEFERERAALEAGIARIVQLSDPDAAAALHRQLETLDAIQLANAVSYGIDATPIEKQALLEAGDTLDRCRMLNRILEMRLAEQRLPGTSTEVN